MTDPRPVEGPDREARIDIGCPWCGQERVPYDDMPAETGESYFIRHIGTHAKFLGDGADCGPHTIRVALLPSPLAPGGDLCVYCTVTRYGCDALRAKGNACCSKCKHVPAPDGGDTDLRAAVDALKYARRKMSATLIAVAPHLDKPYSNDPRTPWEHMVVPADTLLRAAVDGLTAALAARPDADRDALARVRAECDREIDAPRYTSTEARIAWADGYTAACDTIRAALGDQS